MAGPQAKSNNKASSKAGSKKKIHSEASHQAQMKLVGIDTCIKCPSQCQRGLDYIEKMNIPGSFGRGVPCILTRK